MARQRDGVINIFNNPWEKYRAFKTVAIYITFFSLGLGSSVVGTTINSMEILLDTDTKSISAAFSGGSLGYMAGSIVCGFIYSPMNKELLFALALIGEGISLGVAPFSGHLYIFVAFCVTQGFCMAMIDTGGQSYILKLWENQKHKESAMQGAHGIWSVGATIGPFVIRPFLVDIKQHLDERNTTEVFVVPDSVTDNVTVLYDGWNNSVFYGSGTQYPTYSTDAEDDLRAEVAYVRIAYMIIASVIVISSIIFLIIFCMIGPSCCDPQKQKKSKEDKIVITKSYKIFKISLLIFMFFMYFAYLWVEGLPGSYLAAFVVQQLNWPNNYGALIVATYWGSHGLGRLLAIPIAAWLSPRDMIFINMIMTACGFAMLFFLNFFEFLIWIGIALAGLGMSSIFASGVLWLETYIEVTGAASAVLLSASSFGGIVAPILTGYMFDAFSPMWFIFIVFTASIVELIIFIGAYFYAEKNRKNVHSQKSTKRKSIQEEDTEEKTPVYPESHDHDPDEIKPLSPDSEHHQAIEMKQPIPVCVENHNATNSSQSSNLPVV